MFEKFSTDYHIVSRITMQKLQIYIEKKRVIANDRYDLTTVGQAK
jgi:hypothetical protein